MDLMAAGAARYSPEEALSVADRFEELARETPDQIFLQTVEGEIVSYGELDRQSCRYAQALLGLGLEPGQVVAVMLDNCPEFFYAQIGCAKIGVIPALVNTATRGPGLDHVLRVTGARMALIKHHYLPVWAQGEGLCRELPCWVVDGEGDAFESSVGALPVQARSWQPLVAAVAPDAPPVALRSEIRGRDPFCYLFTSGTTGMPKAALMSHARWLGVGSGWKNLLQVSSADVFYCMLPLFHGAAGVSLVSNAVAGGAAIVLRKRFSASAFWSDVRRHGVTLFQYIGEVCRYLAQRPAEPRDRQHSIRAMTGAGLSRELWSVFRERFGVPHIYEGYGGTETNCNLLNVDNHPGSCGRIPFPEQSNARLFRYDVEQQELIMDAAGRPSECKPGEVGELLGLVLNLPGVSGGRFEGYTDPEANEKKLMRNLLAPGDVWYRTGDLFIRDPEDYYYFVDRAGDSFRWKSENVSTMEVASILSSLPGAEMVNVYGVTVPGHEGRAGMAAVVMQEGCEFDPRELYRLAREQLPEYAMPLFVRVASQADLTASFKLRKYNLQQQSYDPRRCKEPLFIRDPSAETYISYSEDNLRRLEIPPA